MAYFGNEPIQSTYLTNYFSGDTLTTAFTLTRAPISSSSILVFISGVKQHVSTYGVSGTTLTFSAAPPTGTNNIEVLHLGIAPETVTLPSYRTITESTATEGQTTFSPSSYTAGYIDVYRNGVKLGSDDFTATNGTSVVLNNSCSAGDILRFESFLITSFNNAIPNTSGAVSSSLLANSLDLSGKTVTYGLSGSDMPSGSVLQVVQTVKTDTFSMSSTTWADITGLSLNITPSSTSSKILVFYNVPASTNGGAYSGNFKLVRDTTDIFLGDASGTITRASSGYFSDYYGYGMRHQNNMYLDSPSTTSAITYKMQVMSGYSGYVVYVGRGYTEADNIPYARVPSTITAMEIAG